MWMYPDTYGVIVVGGGHAGCEAALAAARMGLRTLLLTMNLDTLSKMSCNPAVGGIAKGHLVREIDALGGEMGKVIDATGIQFRMLNATKGPAVWAPRAQADKAAYSLAMKHRLEATPHLELRQGTVEELLVQEGRIQGVKTREGVAYQGTTVVISSGTFLRGLLHVGENSFAGGRAGEEPCMGLSASLLQHGITLGRLKTGTPPRIHRRSIDFGETEVQEGEEWVHFSYDERIPRLPQVPCYILYTTPQTREVILRNLHRSPLYSGKIKSVGPRYCPSIEDKIVRFADKERHQIFLEPEGLQTDEFYVNGMSSSLPFDVQLDYLHSIPALRKAEVTRPAYAIEYDYVVSGQIRETLESKKIQGLFFAGQINGTTGYEEAAGQGLMAGINAACQVMEKEPFVLQRSEAYLGVMIDDLITKTLDEPYRLFTSRAEHRLLLRQDNADLRLRGYGFQLGLIDATRYERLRHKKELISQETRRLAKVYKVVEGKVTSLSQLLSRPEITYRSLCQLYPDHVMDHGDDVNLEIELELKYAGYIQRQQGEVEKLSHIEKIRIPSDFDYPSVKGLRNEARQKLLHHQPTTLGQAARISGVSPADISILMVTLARR